jgi:hypothetical protein
MTIRPGPVKLSPSTGIAHTPAPIDHATGRNSTVQRWFVAWAATEYAETIEA